MAATGHFGIEAGTLFIIQFFWQFPHLWAIGWFVSDDYKKAGFSYMGTPIILNETNKFSGTFKIEFRENRYRASIWNLNSKGMDMTFYSGGIGLGSEINTSLEELLLKNNREEFRKNFYKVNGKIIDVTFIDLMNFTGETKENDKW